MPVGFRYFARVAATTSAGSSGPGRLLVPPDAFEVVANILFVKRGLRAAGLVAVRGPEPGRIRRQGLIDPDQLIVRQAEFEFRVCQDDPARLGIGSRASINFQTDGANLFGKFPADSRCRFVKRNILVVAGGGLGGRRENRFRQPFGFAQPRRQRNSADFSRGAIILPSRARQDIRARRIQSAGVSSAGKAWRGPRAAVAVGRAPAGNSVAVST